MDIEKLGITKEEIMELIDSKIEFLFDSEDYQEIIQRRMAKRIDEKMEERVAALIDPIIENMASNLLEKEIFQVNSYGEITGERKILKEIVYEKLTGYWSERIDRNGRVANKNDIYYPTRADVMMDKIIHENIDKMLSDKIGESLLNFKNSFSKDLQLHVSSCLDNYFVNLPK